MSTTRAPTGDDIAHCVLEAFQKLPPKRKPLHRDDGKREWVPLSGIVLARSKKYPLSFLYSLLSRHFRRNVVDLRVSGVDLSFLFNINLLTLFRIGMKCLPRSKIPQANGTVLHDWHAEILAIRAFNRFLIYECAALVNPHSSSQFVRRRRPDEVTESSPQPFVMESDVSIYMYCSEAPCGDASMELTMQAQIDPTPWEVQPNNDGSSKQGDGLHGRGYFSQLGVVRRKPGQSLFSSE
jgi:tRNA-specific adenosine deaminase 1